MIDEAHKDLDALEAFVDYICIRDHTKEKHDANLRAMLVEQEREGYNSTLKRLGTLGTYLPVMVKPMTCPDDIMLLCM